MASHRHVGMGTLLMFVYFSIAAEGPQCFECSLCFYFYIMKRILKEMVVRYSNAPICRMASWMDEEAFRTDGKKILKYSTCMRDTAEATDLRGH
jgi:hypothetical protein